MVRYKWELLGCLWCILSSALFTARVDQGEAPGGKEKGRRILGVRWSSPSDWPGPPLCDGEAGGTVVLRDLWLHVASVGAAGIITGRGFGASEALNVPWMVPGAAASGCALCFGEGAFPTRKAVLHGGELQGWMRGLRSRHFGVSVAKRRRVSRGCFCPLSDSPGRG